MLLVINIEGLTVSIVNLHFPLVRFLQEVHTKQAFRTEEVIGLNKLYSMRDTKLQTVPNSHVRITPSGN